MSFFDAAQGLAAAAGGLAFANEVSGRGQEYAGQMADLGATLQDQSAFKGYTVKTGLGSGGVGADGSMTLGAGPDATMQANAMNMMSGANPYDQYGQQAAANAMGMNTAAREQDIYNRAMAMQQPQLDAQRAAGNAQEYAMGRGGVMGSQFGGSGEDAAMARAQAQAQNAASFQAMGQAQQEMMNQGQLAGTFGQLGNAQGQLGVQQYNASFTPMQQQLAAMQVANQGGQMAQTGQLTGAGYVGQLGLGGIQTAVNADKSASELQGNVIAALLANSQQEGGGWLSQLFNS